MSLLSSLANERLASALPNDKGLSLLDWSLKYRSFLRPDVRLDFNYHKYLLAIYQDTAQRIVLYKSGQAGVSEYLIGYSIHACDIRSLTVLYAFSTDKHVSDFSSARVGPAVEASDYLQGLVVSADAKGGKSGADRVTLKRIRNRFLYLRGSAVDANGQAPQLKSVDADILVLDEMDEMDPRAPAIAQKRLGHSLVSEERWASTPTYHGIGIHAAYLESDQREWFIRCGSCGKAQALTIEHVVQEWDTLGRPVAWHGMREGRAYAACQHCGRELDRLSAGEWVATYPDRETHGYHVTKLFSPQNELIGIVRALDTTDETRRKETYNQDLALPYKPRGSGLDDTVLDDLRCDYGHGARGEKNLMGVDVGSVLHVVIRGQADKETLERPQLWAGEVDSFEDLGRMMREYRIKTCVIDALPETKKAREFQAAFPRGRVWLAYYVAQKVGSKDSSSASWNGKEWTVNLDRTRTLDEMFARFAEGENTLPGNARGIRDYYSHMKAPTRIIETTTTGERVARYVESGADHFAHAENYCAVASVCTMGEVWIRGMGQ